MLCEITRRLGHGTNWSTLGSADCMINGQYDDHMTHTNRIHRLLAAAALCAQAACSQLHAPTPTPATPPAAAAPMTMAAPAIGPQLQIDTAQSLIAVTVRRGGVLARLGHDHVVAARKITGTVSPAENHADFQFRLDEMTVDESDLRLQAGLEKQPSADAIEGTRHNMLTKVLDAERYPLVSIHAERGAPGQPLRVTITLHGVTRTIPVPVELSEKEGAIRVKGTLTLNQTDFGLTPFSVMGGAMAVQDQMELRFALTAK
jgi:polyisoprenoid-binding protein YceI